MKLLIDEKGRKYLVDREVFHTNLGVVNLKNAKHGDIVESHLGYKFYVLNPRVVDICEKMPRRTSIILKKDLGAVITYTGLGSGDFVLDAGTGSGSVAITFANIVKPHGRVYTYEKRENFYELAKRNIEMSGLSEYVEMKLKNIYEGIDERDLDVIFFDLPEPWLAIPHAYEALKKGGFIVVYNPYIEQVKKSVEALKKADFKLIKTVEILEREIEVKDIGTRPATRMISHTAYLTFARKL